jgi:carbonic anhydrase
MTSNIEITVSPDIALERLKEGNQRFVSEEIINYHQSIERRRRTAKEGQQPFAAVLTCSDSRVPVEIIFDQGIGDIFVVRVAGNVCNSDEIGCIEYAVEQLNVPLVVIMGHTDCGAVTALAKREKMHGSVAPLVANINWALAKARKKNPQLDGDSLIPAGIEANVWQSVEDLFKGSRMLCRRIKGGSLEVIGAIYDLESGVVNWLGPHPHQDALI